jgi:hypothetical protein
VPFLIVANPESGRPGDDLPAAAAALVQELVGTNGVLGVLPPGR